MRYKDFGYFGDQPNEGTQADGRGRGGGWGKGRGSDALPVASAPQLKVMINSQSWPGTLAALGTIRVDLKSFLRADSNPLPLFIASQFILESFQRLPGRGEPLPAGIGLSSCLFLMTPPGVIAAAPLLP